MLDPKLIEPEKLRALKRAEYQRLIELGYFDDERIELIDGVIVEMAPQGPRHVSPIQQLNYILLPQLLGRAIVRIQADFLAAGESEPVPDVAIVPLGDYRNQHPDRAHCIIEVAHSSLRKDQLVKAPLYARSGFGEYWVVNVPERCIEVFRDGDGAVYRKRSRHGIDEALAFEAFPDVSVRVADVFG
jgi:Uma2 family endonuclease